MANEISSRVGVGVDERRISAWIGTALVVQGKVISTQDLTIDGKVEEGNLYNAEVIEKMLPAYKP